MQHATTESIGLKSRPQSLWGSIVAGYMRRAADAYFFAFTDTDNGKCPNCHKSLGGMFGTFVYGICYGEGNCSSCGWPCRADHEVGALGGPGAICPRGSAKYAFSLNRFILPYHEDFVTVKAKQIMKVT